MNTKQIGILFMPDMVRAYRAGHKKQTRRLLYKLGKARANRLTSAGHPEWPVPYPAPDGMQWNINRLASARPGDVLWGRETYAPGVHQLCDEKHFVYAADPFGHQHRLGDRWIPSIHMPREAARIVAPITEVRIERLQDISAEDAMAEGIIELKRCCCKAYGLSHADPLAWGDPIGRYQMLWEKINGAESWAQNPPVIVLSFE